MPTKSMKHINSILGSANLSRVHGAWAPLRSARVSPAARCWRLAAVCLALTCCFAAWAARFADRIRYEQPDGAVLELRGEGNEYQAVYETLDGFTVVFVPEARAYHYATRSPAGDRLVSAGVEPGKGDPAALGLRPHLRIDADAARAQALRTRAEFEERVALKERWGELKAAQAAAGGAALSMLRYGPTLGSKCGLALVIDFDDQPGTLPLSAFEAFLNGDNYRANNNKGSVKEYYRDVSDGLLLYTNLVVGYVRIPKSLHPRAYYNDVGRGSSLCVNDLIRDALQVLRNRPDYATEIMPRFEALSVNDANEVLALNVFVTGADSGVWGQGLWPHMDSLSVVGPQPLWPGGRVVNMYQMTTTTFSGAALQIGTFCHETGHLLCGFPDIYDYDSSSVGGAGGYCLMNNWVDLTNPQHFCAYLKMMAGWATLDGIRAGPAQTLTLHPPGTNGNHYARYRPVQVGRLPGHEYFLIENRQRIGRDAQIPGAGILVWHIDEQGNNYNESLLPNALHANYEVTLVQADNRWELQRNVNAGDTTDPFYAGNPTVGYVNQFSDTTLPGAGWWDGTRSGLELRDFSARGSEMTVTAEVKQPQILRDPFSQTVNAGSDLLLSVQMAGNAAYAYTWLRQGVPLAGSGRAHGANGPALSITGVKTGDAGAYQVVVTGPGGYAETSRVAQVTVLALRALVSADLGDAAAMPGNTALVNVGYQVTGAGSGLAGALDSVRFLWEKVSGDFDARVSVVDLYPEDSQLAMFGRPVYGQAGLMVRAAVDPGSVAAAVMLQPDLFVGTALQAWMRPGSFAPAVELARSQGAPPKNNWARIRREGELVTLYTSSDGSAWNSLGTVQLPLGTEAFVGPAVTSGNPLVRVVSNLKFYSVRTDLPSTFAIAAVRDSAREGTAESARLMVTASRNGPLQAGYTFRDTNPNGVGHALLDGVVNIPEGTNVAFIDIVPLNDAITNAPGIVSVSLTGNGVTQSTLGVLLFDDEAVGHGLKREFYASIPGAAVADLTGHYSYPESAAVGVATLFEASIGPNGGQVLSGYLIPPVTGAYRFYLASAGASELWLSPDVSPDNVVKIAEERGANTKRNWAGYGPTNHISAPVELTEGAWYFVKVIHKAGAASPHLAVAWQMPGAEPPLAGSAPIPGNALAWALPVTPPALDQPLRLRMSPAGHALLSLENPGRSSLTVEATSELRQWTPIGTTNVFEDLDLTAWDTAGQGAAMRFYRVRQ